MLGDPSADFDNRRFLKRIGSDHAGRHLARQAYQRDTVQFRVCDGRHKIRRPGTACCHRNADFTGAPRVPLGGKRPTLFVARKNSADRSPYLVSDWCSGMLQPPG